MYFLNFFAYEESNQITNLNIKRLNIPTLKNTVIYLLEIH